MEQVVPILPIDDGKAAKKFYVDGLGFEVEFEWRHEPGFPVHMSVAKGALRLHLSEHAKGQAGVDMYIFVDDVEAWRTRCDANQISIERGPEKMPWGNTEMTLSDPFGSLLRVTQLNTHEPTATSA